MTLATTTSRLDMARLARAAWHPQLAVAPGGVVDLSESLHPYRAQSGIDDRHGHGDHMPRRLIDANETVGTLLTMLQRLIGETITRIRGLRRLAGSGLSS